MAYNLFLCTQLPIHPDVNRVIFDLYYNTFPRPNGCNVYYDKHNHFIYGDIIKNGCDNYFYDGNQFQHNIKYYLS